MLGLGAATENKYLRAAHRQMLTRARQHEQNDRRWRGYRHVVQRLNAVATAGIQFHASGEADPVRDDDRRWTVGMAGSTRVPAAELAVRELAQIALRHESLRFCALTEQDMRWAVGRHGR